MNCNRVSSRAAGLFRLRTLVLALSLGVLASGCNKLFNQGINVSYGVHSLQVADGKRAITAITLENKDTKPYTSTQVELEFVLENGNTIKKTYSPGTLEVGKEWVQEMDSPVDDVASINFNITTAEGSGKGTLDVKNADWKSIPGKP